MGNDCKYLKIAIFIISLILLHIGINNNYLEFLRGLNNSLLDFVVIKNNSSVIKLSALLYISVFIYLIYLSVIQYVLRQYIFREIKYLLVLLLICLPIILVGPFLQTPSDPIHHSTILVDSLIDDSKHNLPNVAFLSIGLYKCLAIILDGENPLFTKLYLLLLYHSIIGIILISTTFISSRLYGLPVKWSYLSVFLMLFLFGTDQFSYYTYYSLAPTSLNLPLYWLFMSITLRLIFYKAKLDRQSIFNIIWILFIILCLIPIIYYSHRQESAFFFYHYVFIFFALLFFALKVIPNSGKYYYIFSLPILFFPFSLLRKLNIVPENIFYSVGQYPNFIVNIFNIWYIGYWNAHRIYSTLSIYGFLPLLFLILHFFSKNKRREFMGIIPGVFPFWIMFIPFNFFIWIYSVQSEGALYRLTYSSQYWISIAYFFFMFEYKVAKYIRKIKYFKNETKIKIFKENYFIIMILILFILISYISRPPIYGKLKFILLNTYWPYFDIAKEFEQNNKFLHKSYFYSDPVSEYTFYGVFGMRSPQRWRTLDTYPYLTIEIPSLISKSNPPTHTCLINLKGFPDTWVPRLTGHWDPIISNTARFYEHNGYRGKKLAITIENQFKDRCIVLKDKELPWEEDENFRYRSPNLNYTEQQEDVHILQFKKDSLGYKYNILIDAGMIPQVADKLLDYLAINEIYRIDEIFITHPHKDHYSGLYELIKFGIPIKKVWMNMPLKENCNKEIPWGCDFADLEKLVALMKEKGIEHREIFHTNPKEPVTLYKDKHNELSLLFASPPVNPQAGNVDINDLSMIMKLNTNGTTYLFSGDLNNSLSNYLKTDPAFKADIFKVPHHGTEGVASNEFFDTVGAKIGIVPSPQHLWCSDRSSRIRNYFKEKKTKMVISGFQGDILIRHFENGKYKLTNEVEPEEICGEKIPKPFWKRFF